MTETTCPDWCNREHRPNANPRRISHEHKFRPTEKGSSGVRDSVTAAGYRIRSRPAWVTTYPVPSSQFAPCACIRFTAYGELVTMVLALDDLRALAADLSQMADHLEREQSELDARKAVTA